MTSTRSQNFVLRRDQINVPLFKDSVIQNIFEDNQEEHEIYTEIDLTKLGDKYEDLIDKLQWCNFFNLNVTCFKNLIFDLEVEKF